MGGSSPDEAGNGLRIGAVCAASATPTVGVANGEFRLRSGQFQPKEVCAPSSQPMVGRAPAAAGGGGNRVGEPPRRHGPDDGTAVPIGAPRRGRTLHSEPSTA